MITENLWTQTLWEKLRTTESVREREKTNEEKGWKTCLDILDPTIFCVNVDFEASQNDIYFFKYLHFL